MRVALSVLAILTIVLFALVLVLMYGSGGLSDTDPRFGISILATLVGIVMALATFIVGAIAAAMRRQVAWLIGLIVAAVVAIALPFVAGAASASVYDALATNPACQSALTRLQCQPTGLGALIVNTAQVAVFVAPVLVGIVALIYSFRMRATSARTATART